MSETMLATMSIVAILVLGVVMEPNSLPQQGLASRGCTPGSIADEASNGLCLRDTPTDFTVTGTGTGNSKSFKCNPPVPANLMISMNFHLFLNQGIANGTYFIFASDGNSVTRCIYRWIYKWKHIYFKRYKYSLHVKIIRATPLPIRLQ